MTNYQEILSGTPRFAKYTGEDKTMSKPEAAPAPQPDELQMLSDLQARVDYFNARLALLADLPAGTYTVRELAVLLWPGTTFGAGNPSPEFEAMWKARVLSKDVHIEKLPAKWQERARKDLFA
jgi:hypothetical protein